METKLTLEEEQENQWLRMMFNEIVNVWWKKYRNTILPLDDEQVWCAVVDEAGELMAKFNHHPIAVNVIQGLLNILDRRAREHAKEAADSGTGEKAPV